MKTFSHYCNRKNFYIVVTWVLVYILVLYAAFFTCLNDFRQVSFSSDNRDIYVVNRDVLQAGEFYGTTYYKGFQVDLSKNNEQYVRIVAEGITNKETTVSFDAGSFDKNGNYLVSETSDIIPLHEGNNDIELHSTDFTYFEIYVVGEQSVVLKDLQFRNSAENESIAYARSFTQKVALAYLAFTVLIAALAIISKRQQKKALLGYNRRLCIEVQPKCKGFTKITSYISRVLFFTIVTISLLLVAAKGEKGYGDYFTLYILIQLSLTLLAAFFIYLDSQQKRQLRIDREAVLICSLLSAYVFASDILVDKVYRFSGTGVFFALTFFGFAWLVNGKNTDIVKDFEISIQSFLVLLIILSIVIRDETIPGRLSGPINNPSIYALYLGGIWAVLLGSAENHILNNNSRCKTLTAGEMIVTLILALMSQSLTPLIAIVLVTSLWVFRVVANKKNLEYACKLYLSLVIIGITIIVGLIIYARNFDGESGSRLIAKLQATSLSSFLSNRDYYWKEYLRHMNLFGHSKKPFLWDHRILPHNALIGMMYWYGVPCVIPYILMMMMAIEKSWRYANTGLKYAAVPFYSIVSFVIMSMADNVEQPFVWLPWIACYLMMAPILIMPVEEIEAMKSANADIFTEESEQI